MNQNNKQLYKDDIIKDDLESTFIKKYKNNNDKIHIKCLKCDNNNCSKRYPDSVKYQEYICRKCNCIFDSKFILN